MSINGHKRTYAVEPQRRDGIGDAGWVMCGSDEATRFVLVELTIWHQRVKGRAGPKRQFRKRRVLSSFEGTNAEGLAMQALAAALRRK